MRGLDFDAPFPAQMPLTSLPGIVEYHRQRLEELAQLDSRQGHVLQRLLKPADYLGADPEHYIKFVQQGALKAYVSLNTIAKPASPDNTMKVSPTTKCHKQER